MANYPAIPKTETDTRRDGKRPPPQAEVRPLSGAPRIEEELLGVLVLGPPELISSVRSTLEPFHFYSEDNRRIYEAICALHDSGQAVTAATVAAWLEENSNAPPMAHLALVCETGLFTSSQAVVRNLATRIIEHYVRWRKRQLHSQALFALEHGHYDEAERLEAEISELQVASTAVAQASKEICAADLAESEAAELEFLPLLGQPGYIVRGWTTLIAGSPKSGKSELLTRLCLEWQDESILYITEEPKSIWQQRIAGLAGNWNHVTLLFAVGATRAEILQRVRSGSESTVVIDTLRSALTFEDECDNAEIGRTLNPLIAAAREGGKTLILAHHLRKGGGIDGEAISGGHAILGCVDTALELLRDSSLKENQRRIRGWSRLIPIEELVYELEPDGRMIGIGSPMSCKLDAVRERLVEVLGGEWRTRQEILALLEEPRPSMEQLRLALESLVESGDAERDPTEKRRGVTVRWRLASEVKLPPIDNPVVTITSEAGENELPPIDNPVVTITSNTSEVKLPPGKPVVTEPSNPSENKLPRDSLVVTEPLKVDMANQSSVTTNLSYGGNLTSAGKLPSDSAAEQSDVGDFDPFEPEESPPPEPDTVQQLLKVFPGSYIVREPEEAKESGSDESTSPWD